MEMMVTLPTKLGPLNAFRLLEAMNLQRTFGDASLAIEGGGLQRNLYGIALRLPLLGGKRSLQGDEPHVHVAVARTGLARAVDDVGMHGIAKSRLVLLGDGRIRLGRELDLEGTIGARTSSAM